MTKIAFEGPVCHIFQDLLAWNYMKIYVHEFSHTKSVFTVIMLSIIHLHKEQILR